MSNHVDYLAKANRLRELTMPDRDFLPEDSGLATTRPSAIADSSQWMRLARFLELGKPQNELVSVGVFPASDDSGEPDTFIIGLALSLRTLYSCKVVIVDLSMDGTELAVPLGAPVDPGMWEALQSEPNLRRGCIHETSTEGVFLIPRGIITPIYSPDEFERRLRWLDGALARNHEVIVYRFPRAKQMRALRNCFKIPGISFLTVIPGVARKSDVRRESDFLREAGANLVGVVLTEEPQWR